jgi:hypothetical protein
LFLTAYWIAARGGWVGPLPQTQALVSLRGGRFAFGEIFSVLLSQLSIALGLMMLFLLLRMMLRRTWIAAAVLCLLQAALTGLNLTALAMAITIFLLVRFGLVALLALTVFSGLGQVSPVTFDASSPHFTTGLLFTLVAWSLAFYGWKTSLAGRPLLQDPLS